MCVHVCVCVFVIEYAAPGELRARPASFEDELRTSVCVCVCASVFECVCVCFSCKYVCVRLFVIGYAAPCEQRARPASFEDALHTSVCVCVFVIKNDVALVSEGSPCHVTHACTLA